MRPKRDQGSAEQSSPASAPLDIRPIASAPDWRISTFVCHAGPDDKPFEEQHDLVSIAAVVEGSFQYHTDTGRALLYPGAFLLGNSASCFACGHAHGRGDRCIAFQFAPEFFAEIAASIAGSSRFRFAAGMIPAVPEMMRIAVSAEHAALHPSMASEELAVSVAERAITLMSGHRARPISPSARDEKRISAALRHIEASADDPLDLDTLAGAAAMSKYHFLRCFRGIVGLTPYQYVLGMRLRRAAIAVTTSARPIAALALEAGFGDVSTFNAHFRHAFGRTPTAMRRASS
jgi:AraC family transcriptional regulator